MMVLVSWERQSPVMGDAGLIKNLSFIEGASLPMMAFVSWEMQSSVMEDAELSHGRYRAESWKMQSSVMGDAELSHGRYRPY
jgi:hypothetical protein